VTRGPRRGPDPDMARIETTTRIAELKRIAESDEWRRYLP
jgi:hypothetical protein